MDCFHEEKKHIVFFSTAGYYVCKIQQWNIMHIYYWLSARKPNRIWILQHKSTFFLNKNKRNSSCYNTHLLSCAVFFFFNSVSALIAVEWLPAFFHSLPGVPGETDLEEERASCCHCTMILMTSMTRSASLRTTQPEKKQRGTGYSMSRDRPEVFWKKGSMQKNWKAGGS